jgi:CTP:molybdopterin cytidylyltransferase MocA
MIALSDTALVLLCAGQSRRFGPTNKLLHPLGGKPLVLHAAQMLAALPFAVRLATVPEGEDVLDGLLAAAGFQTIPLADDVTQPQSLDAGLGAALALSPASVCVALGDMPYATAAHIEALADAATPAAPTASQGDGWIGPPWIAAADWVRTNRRAIKAALARQATPIAAPPAALKDIDTLSDL